MKEEESMIDKVRQVADKIKAEKATIMKLKYGFTIDEIERLATDAVVMPKGVKIRVSYDSLMAVAAWLQSLGEFIDIDKFIVYKFYYTDVYLDQSEWLIEIDTVVKKESNPPLIYRAGE